MFVCFEKEVALLVEIRRKRNRKKMRILPLPFNVKITATTSSIKTVRSFTTIML